MIISDRYRYLFVELPRTGTTAISKELVENYEGKPILHKHATYSQFLKSASEDQSKYFVFSCIRNPIDRIVSFYVKCAQGFYDYKFEKQKLRLYEKYYLIPRVKFIQDRKTSFDEYLKTYHKWPYVDWSVLDHHKFNCTIKFENLNEDFKEVLNELGVAVKRDLPKTNVTTNKRKFEDYLTPESSELYAKIFGPAMCLTGYKMPFDLTKNDIPQKTWMKYYIIRTLKSFYWRYFK
jgi:hypothetical protein